MIPPERQPVRGVRNPTPEEMRRHAVRQIQDGLGHRIEPVSGRGSNCCYLSRLTGRYYHIYTNKPGVKSSTHRIYYFGNTNQVWKDSHSVFVLQCGLDFTVVATIEDWMTFKDRMGLAQDGRVLQHVHWDRQLVELREREGFVLPLNKWINDFDSPS